MTEENVLTKELMILQLGQMDLLIAMYESDNAISIDATSSHLLDYLRDWCESDRETIPDLTEKWINMILELEISDESDMSRYAAMPLQLNLAIPLTYQGSEQGLESTEPPPVKVRIQQPAWMSKSEVAQLNLEIPDEDILTVIEHVKEAVSQHLKTSPTVNDSSVTEEDVSITRVWFYFPSISTRSKRDDFVQYAPTYGLTGFLLAGKPGILCLEGGSLAIDNFMKFIKTESWGDIPSHHKKVSERYRETGPNVGRAFQDMQEITDMLGERRGERANRSDMKALEAWLDSNGLKEAFGKVFV